MCEGCHERGYGWKGWIELPPPRFESGSGPWIDLSYPIGPGDALRFDFPKAQLSQAEGAAAGPFPGDRVQHGRSRRNPRRFSAPLFSRRPGVRSDSVGSALRPGVVGEFPRSRIRSLTSQLSNAPGRCCSRAISWPSIRDGACASARRSMNDTQVFRLKRRNGWSIKG